MDREQEPRGCAETGRESRGQVASESPTPGDNSKVRCAEGTWYQKGQLGAEASTPRPQLGQVRNKTPGPRRGPQQEGLAWGSYGTKEMKVLG